jgi:integrase/recombinase XerC
VSGDGSGLRKERAIRGRDMTDGNEASFRGLVRFLEGGRGATPKTLAAYHQACLSLQSYLVFTGCDPDLLSVTRAQVLGWVAELRSRGGWSLRDGALTQRGKGLAKDSLASYYSSARRFYNWALSEDLIDASPFENTVPPKPADKPVEIPELDLIRAMIDTCHPKGRKPSAWDLRDDFVIRLFSETGGPRCHEVAGLLTAHVDLRDDLVKIHGKGDTWRRFPLAPKTATSAQRWLRARAGLRFAALPYAVIGTKGQMHPEGVYDIIDRRSRQAGGHVHPHAIRHLAADLAKADEMTDDDMMALFGWSTSKMLHRYGRERQEQRAIAASRRHAIGNRL